jgi:hypothetical protein
MPCVGAVWAGRLPPPTVADGVLGFAGAVGFEVVGVEWVDVVECVDVLELEFVLVEGVLAGAPPPPVVVVVVVCLAA